MKIVPISVQWITGTPFPEHVIERCGRICYQSDHKVVPCRHPHHEGSLPPPCPNCGDFNSNSAEAFVGKILKNGHESVLEHVSATLLFTVDRGVTHELVRHRLCAFSQESTRYCGYSGDRFGGEMTFIEPPGLQEVDRAVWRDTLDTIEGAYLGMSGNKVTAQIARSILPNALKADIAVTTNAREWRHICRLRLSPKAHPQMIEAMRLAHGHLLQWFPQAFQEFAKGS